jgi:hypothetical protein
MLRVLAFIAVLLSGGAALSGPYWIDWQGDNWPESVGYERAWGDAQGLYHGTGAARTLQGGVLTYDSLYDPSVYDVYEMDRPGQIDPGPGEAFVMEWGLKVDAVNGASDPGLALFSDAGWGLFFLYTPDHIRSAWEGYLNIPFAPYMWHDYRLVSGDMRAYDLFIDGQLARRGTFAQVISESEVLFGDQSATASSLHHWDYLRFGVIPEPSGSLLLLWILAWRGARRGSYVSG